MEFQAPQPGPEHNRFRRQQGHWNAEIVTTPFPGQPGIRWNGTIELGLSCSGMWQTMDFRGELMGRPFEGRGLAGFDPIRKKYVQSWVDNLSPMMLILEGECDKSGNILTMTCDIPGSDGQVGKMKQVTEERSDGRITFVISLPMPGGGEFEVMRAVYSRA